MRKLRPGSATERCFSLFSLTHGLREEIGVSIRSELFETRDVSVQQKGKFETSQSQRRLWTDNRKPLAV